MITKRIYVTLVGQMREFDKAVFSHVNFINQLKNSINFDKDIVCEIYLSIVTWDVSYSIFPKGVKSFITDVSEEFLSAVIGNMFEHLTVKTYIKLVSDSEATQLFLDIGNTNSVDEFHSVSYLHEKSLDLMLQIEQDENFKFDFVILTRPDLYIQTFRIDGAIINNINDTTVYYKNAQVLVTRESLTPVKNDPITQYEEFADQFNIFGRTAFYAYGLMFRYIIADRANKQFFYNPSLHFWVSKFLEKFRISKSELTYIDLAYLIVRPTYKIIDPDIDFSIGDPVLVADKLRNIEFTWQQDIADLKSYERLIKQFTKLKIDFSEARDED